MQPRFDTLRDLACRGITCHHAHHDKGFAHNRWTLFEKEHPRHVKPLLHVYRVPLTVIHLMEAAPPLP